MDDPKKSVTLKNYKNFDGFRLKIKSDIHLGQYLFTLKENFIKRS